MKKYHRKSRQTNFLIRRHAICNLHLCYNFILVLNDENALVFSQLEAHNFFIYIYYP